MNPLTSTTTRVDLHCHSTASEVSKLGIQRSLGLPECATPPQEVYELAKRRGMDLVTITDHDTIEGCLAISERPDVFISEELTVWFRNEPQAVHVLCLGITPDDHEWLQAHNRDLEACADYLHSNEIACSLAHPFYAVEAPLTPAHRRRLAQLFPVWETRNGSRARELNMPAAIYIETHGGTGTGGSDDHAGVDIGRTYTETPPAATPEQFLRHVREGRAEAHGEQGSAAKWAHAAMALATRALLLDTPGREAEEVSMNGEAAHDRRPADPEAALKMAERVMSEGNVRSGSVAGDLGPEDARALLAAFTDSIGLDLRGRALVEHMQSDDFSHAELERRARRAHERKLREAVENTVARLDGDGDGAEPADLAAAAIETGRELFAAAVPAIPYAPAAAFLGKEKQKLTPGDGPKRVALIADAIGGVHGVTHTIERIRDLGVPGHEVEVVGTDRNVDRRLPAAAEVEVPFYAGLEIGVPSLPGMVEVLAEGRFDLVHVTAPGPAGVIATLIARIMEMPVLGSWHTELGAYAGLRSSSKELEYGVDAALSIFYRQCARVLSPSPASDDSLARLGVERDRIGRWGRGVDTSRFDPKLRDPDSFRTSAASSASRPGAADEIKVIYVGRQTKEKGAELLADSFLRAHAADPRLHLLLGGGGPEEGYLRERLGDRATFLGWLEGDELPRAYASADIFLFTSRTDTFGQVLVEAGASGLPVVAVAEGGPTSIVVDGETGRLCEPDPELIAAALLQLADAPAYRAKLGRQGLAAARARTWEAAMAQLADGYAAVLEPEPSAGAHPPWRRLPDPLASTGMSEDALETTPGTRSAEDEGVAVAPGAPPTADGDGKIDLTDSSLYYNRELSWLDFNERVLQLAEDPSVPLLERVKFCSIYQDNLDEFYMVRVANLHDQVEAGLDARGADGIPSSEVIGRIRERVIELRERLHRCFDGELVPALSEHGIRLITLADADEAERAELERIFTGQIFPALTPLVIGRGRPFPYISNVSLSIAVLLRNPEKGEEVTARVKVPKELLRRFLAIGDGRTFVPLEEVIAGNLDDLFPGMEIVDHSLFRVTRDTDYDVSDEAADMLLAVEEEVRRRRFGEVVRLEVSADMRPELREQLVEALKIEENQVYDVESLLGLDDLGDVASVSGFHELRYPTWQGVTPPRLQQGQTHREVDMFGAIRERDILVHHPYDSFTTSVERFVRQAVEDPNVLAIKQTVYRTSSDSPLVPGLIEATERGKQAVCLVELKARFDESANIRWAKSLEEAGVHVVYGIPGLKTHVKCILVARREGEGVRNYVHIGTGNYNPKTARLYTDVGLFTADPEIGADIAEMFNYLTGYARPKNYRKVLVAPFSLRDGIVGAIEDAIEAHSPERPSRIRLKMNSLLDPSCIQALYRASQAGVEVDLNVRGICALRPGVPGVSENIRVISIVGRFLEHSRIFSFESGGERRILIGSADLMPRNLYNRVELVSPVEDPLLQDQLSDVLERAFADNTNSWEFGSDGRWTRLEPGGAEPRNLQRELMELHGARSEAAPAATT